MGVSFFMKKTYLFLTFIFILAGCLYPARYDGPYKGRVIDANTRKPIEGVVVLGTWSKGNRTVAGVVHEFYDARETLTDKNGEFEISGVGLRVMSNVEPMNVLIFKAGYQHIGIGSWESFKEDGGLLRKKIEWDGDRAIIPLRKWTLKERLERFGSYYVNIPDNMQRLMLKEIEKENKEIGK